MTTARDLAYQELYIVGREKPFQYYKAKNQEVFAEVLLALWQLFLKQHQDKSPSYILLQTNDHQALVKVNFKPFHFAYDDLSGRPMLASEKAMMTKLAYEIKAQGGTVDIEHCMYDCYEKRKKALLAATLGEANFPSAHHSLAESFELLDEREKAPSIAKHGFFAGHAAHSGIPENEPAQQNNKPTAKQ